MAKLPLPHLSPNSAEQRGGTNHIRPNPKTATVEKVACVAEKITAMTAAVMVKLHRAKTSGEPSVKIWGDGTARREFLYAGDLADAVLDAVARFDTLPPLMNVGQASTMRSMTTTAWPRRQ